MNAIERASHDATRIGFVRWIRQGHPDAEFPEAFENESIASLWEVLSKFTHSTNIAILQITTQVVRSPEIPDDSRLVSFESSSLGALATVRERPGFDGDGTDSFKGDTKSWNMALSRFIAEFNINPKNYT